MNILFIIVFVILYELFSIVGGTVMSVLPNWVVLTMCEVAIGMGASALTETIFSKKKIHSLTRYICVLTAVCGCILNIYASGFSLTLLWYNLIGCISVYAGFMIER